MSKELTLEELEAQDAASPEMSLEELEAQDAAPPQRKVAAAASAPSATTPRAAPAADDGFKLPYDSPKARYELGLPAKGSVDKAVQQMHPLEIAYDGLSKGLLADNNDEFAAEAASDPLGRLVPFADDIRHWVSSDEENKTREIQRKKDYLEYRNQIRNRGAVAHHQGPYLNNAARAVGLTLPWLAGAPKMLLSKLLLAGGQGGAQALGSTTDETFTGQAKEAAGGTALGVGTFGLAGRYPLAFPLAMTAIGTSNALSGNTPEEKADGWSMALPSAAAAVVGTVGKQSNNAQRMVDRAVGKVRGASKKDWDGKVASQEARTQKLERNLQAYQDADVSALENEYKATMAKDLDARNTRRNQAIKDQKLDIGGAEESRNAELQSTLKDYVDLVMKARKAVEEKNQSLAAIPEKRAEIARSEQGHAAQHAGMQHRQLDLKDTPDAQISPKAAEVRQYTREQTPRMTDETYELYPKEHGAKMTAADYAKLADEEKALAAAKQAAEAEHTRLLTGNADEIAAQARQQATESAALPKEYWAKLGEIIKQKGLEPPTDFSTFNPKKPGKLPMSLTERAQLVEKIAALTEAEGLDSTPVRADPTVQRIDKRLPKQPEITNPNETVAGRGLGAPKITAAPAVKSQPLEFKTELKSSSRRTDNTKVDLAEAQRELESRKLQASKEQARLTPENIRAEGDGVLFEDKMVRSKIPTSLKDARELLPFAKPAIIKKSPEARAAYYGRIADRFKASRELAKYAPIVTFAAVSNDPDRGHRLIEKLAGIPGVADVLNDAKAYVEQKKDYVNKKVDKVGRVISNVGTILDPGGK